MQGSGRTGLSAIGLASFLSLASFLGVGSGPRSALADAGHEVGVLQGRIVSAQNLDPIEGATVVASWGGGGYFLVTDTTTANGTFTFRLAPGTYDLVAVLGDARWFHRGVAVETRKTTAVPGVLAVEPSEFITVHEKVKHESQRAAPVRSTVKPMMPYSEELVDRNAWALGWVLLEVDVHGTVTGFRYLRRPGHDLDAIIEREVWNLRFEPARDDAGQPMASSVVWKFEWPSYWWALDHYLLTNVATRGALSPNEAELRASTRVLSSGGLFGHGAFLLRGLSLPPCRNDGPINLDMHDAVYRDCSPPDFGRLAAEPIIQRPTTLQ
jgi:hypothetical protein